MTTPPTLEQLAAQTADSICEFQQERQDGLTHINADTARCIIQERILTALQAATAQQAPTQGGDWAEAAKDHAQLAAQVEHERNPAPNRPCRPDEQPANCHAPKPHFSQS